MFVYASADGFRFWSSVFAAFAMTAPASFSKDELRAGGSGERRLATLRRSVDNEMWLRFLGISQETRQFFGGPLPQFTGRFGRTMKPFADLGESHVCLRVQV